ncbi:camp-dependent protein kinase catalytic subunit, partial [Lunasporangiospora selenospora]
SAQYRSSTSTTSSASSPSCLSTSSGLYSSGSSSGIPAYALQESILHQHQPQRRSIQGQSDHIHHTQIQPRLKHSSCSGNIGTITIDNSGSQSAEMVSADSTLSERQQLLEQQQQLEHQKQQFLLQQQQQQQQPGQQQRLQGQVADTQQQQLLQQQQTQAQVQAQAQAQAQVQAQAQAQQAQRLADLARQQQQQQQQQTLLQQQQQQQRVKQPQPAATRRKFNLEDFRIHRTLGTGSFGRVHLVQSRFNSRFYAMKVLKKSEVVRLKQVEHTNNEKMILERVEHPFLINLWGTFQDVRNLYMVMDYVVGGELFTVLRKSQ